MGLFYGSTRPHFFFFFFFFKLKYFSHFSSDFQTIFTIVYRMIRRLHKKKNISKKKSISRPPGWFYFTSPGPQETIFYLRVASGKTKGIVNFCLYTGKTRNFICELLDSKENDIAIFL